MGKKTRVYCGGWHGKYKSARMSARHRRASILATVYGQWVHLRVAGVGYRGGYPVGWVPGGTRYGYGGPGYLGLVGSCALGQGWRPGLGSEPRHPLAQTPQPRARWALGLRGLGSLRSVFRPFLANLVKIPV